MCSRGESILPYMASTKKVPTPIFYRDKKSGRFVSEATWKRSKAHGGTRYVRQRSILRPQNLRKLNVLSFDGYVPVVVRSSKQAKLDSRHLIAVSRFLRTGDTELLNPFVGKRVGGVELLTDPNRLHELADAGLIKLDALYRENRSGRQGK
jgi:hypothetical protein